MGLIGRLGGRKTYLDANVFIYALEEHPAFAEALGALLGEIERGRLGAVTSELSLAETLVKPFREERADLAATYQTYLQTRPSFIVAPVTRAVLVEAARLRAAFPALRLPDAIHAATARRHACPVFLTNDTRVPGLSGLEVLRLSEAA